MKKKKAKNNREEARLVTAEKMAKELGITLPKIYAAARAGTIPSVRIGRFVFFERLQIEKWIADGGKSLPGGWKKGAAE